MIVSVAVLLDVGMELLQLFHDVLERLVLADVVDPHRKNDISRLGEMFVDSSPCSATITELSSYEDLNIKMILAFVGWIQVEVGKCG